MSQSDYIQRKRIATQISAITHIHPDIKENPPPVIIDVITDIKQCSLEKTVSNNPTYNILNAPDATSQDRAVSTPIMGGKIPQFPTAQPVDSNNPSTGATGVSYFKTFNATPGYISNTELRSNYIVNYEPDELILYLPTESLAIGSYITIYNNNNDGSSILLHTNSSDIFGGRFGTLSQTIAITSGNWLTVAYNYNWIVIAKSGDSITTTGNQIQLGTDGDYVKVPNYIEFADGSRQYKSGFTQSYFKTFTSSPEDIGFAELRSNYIVDYISSDAFTLNLPTAGLSLSSFLTIYNNSTNGTSITLSTNSNEILFGGRFGTGLTTLLILPNSWITVAYNPATNTWDCIARSRENQRYSVVASGALVDLSNNNQYLNSDLFLTPDVNNRVFTLVNPQTNPNQGYKIYNSSSSFTLDLSGGNFNGNSRYSSGVSGNLANIPPNSWLQLYSDGTNWRITDKSATNQIFDYTLSGTLTIDGNFQLNSDINLTGTGGTLTIFNPTSNFVADSYLKIFNKGTGTITVTPTGGSNFLGKYGSGTASLILPQNSWVLLVSNGTNWLCDERSVENQRYSVVASGALVDLSNNKQYLNSDLFLTSDVNNRVFILVDPANNPNQGYKIYNNSSVFTLALQTPTGSFNNGSSRYSGPSTGNLENVPPNSWLQLYSDGTNWRITDKSATNQIFDYTLSGTLTITANFQLNSDINLTGTGGTLTIFNPTSNFVSDSYLKIFNKGTGTITVTPTGGSFFFGIFGSGSSSLIIPRNCWVKIVSNGTNWLCDERSPDFNLFAFANGTTLNWSSNYQYLDSKVEFVQPDSTLITNTADFSGTATQSGLILNVATITGGNIITAGSVITFNSKRVIIRGQVSGTLGGSGFYLTNVSQTVSTATNFTNGKAGTGTLSSGTITIATTVTDNLGSATASITTLNPCSTISIGDTGIVSSNPFFIIEGNGSAGTRVSTGALGSVSATAFNATSGTTVQLPNASGVVGRTITLVNSGNTPINLKTSGGSLFGGVFGQILTTGVFPAYYILRATETVVLKSDGTIWETQAGTSLGGARSWVITNPFNISTTVFTDGTTIPITAWRYLDLTNSSLTGLYSNSGIFTNAYPFNITVNIAVVFAWVAGIPVEPVSSTLPIKIGIIQPSGLQGNTTKIENFQAVPSTLSGGSFTQTQANQTFNGIFTLRPTEVVTISAGKYNGSTTTTGRIGSATVYINRIS